MPDFASSFDAYFSWAGGPTGDDAIPVNSCNFSLSQSIDDKGRIASKVFGGTVFVQITPSGMDTMKQLWEWMVDADGKKESAQIEFRNIDSEQVQKKLELTDVYCVQYSESFTEVGSAPMSLSLTLTARELKMFDTAHVNRW
ncbi:type VI secretion system tube protein TssD [Spirosoma aerolatum]|uniref:type VI secretion system tube protein TssD n=1 Tax=Spirosoma aerolatum TaxID=1211326 RepID=UPI0009ABD9A3|nr:type VI secretion system tube protein TssD [Spirosoma aerolatum]